MRICGKALPPRAALLLTSDLVIFTFALPCLLASSLFVLLPTPHPYASLALIFRLMLIGLLCQVTFYYNELYNLQLIRSTSAMLIGLLQGAGMLLASLGLLYALVPEVSPGLERVLAFALALLLITIISRLIALPKRLERVLVIGSVDQSDELSDVIRSCPEWNIQIARSMQAADIGHARNYPASALSVDETACTPAHVDGVIVCADTTRDPSLLDVLLEWKMRGLPVEDATTFYERTTGRVRVDYLQPEWFVFSNGFANGRRKRVTKRTLDIVVAAGLLTLALPAMALVALAIAIEGKGPILFSQLRVGLHGQLFRIYKFRTMTPLKTTSEARWVADEQQRITPLGAFLRTFRLDELPQLINILRGDMSLVGPRPEQPYFCSMLAKEIPYYRQRHTVPPGLTGWAQVRYHYGASIQESKRKLEFDLFYVKHLSLWLDLAVLIETVKVVLVGRGAK
jgi:exopolysaccharide biosynthesis polyprenyl glycosylphosphotransferase